jgi:hypothetical protein
VLPRRLCMVPARAFARTVTEYVTVALEPMARGPDPRQHMPGQAGSVKSAGATRLGNRLVKLAPRMGRRLAEEISQALSEQTVVVVGTNAASTVLPRLAEQLAAPASIRAKQPEPWPVASRLFASRTRPPMISDHTGPSARLHSDSGAGAAAVGVGNQTVIRIRRGGAGRVRRRSLHPGSSHRVCGIRYAVGI